jgi:hypothetical protein
MCRINAVMSGTKKLFLVVEGISLGIHAKRRKQHCVIKFCGTSTPGPLTASASAQHAFIPAPWHIFPIAAP